MDSFHSEAAAAAAVGGRGRTERERRGAGNSCEQEDEQQDEERTEKLGRRAAVAGSSAGRRDSSKVFLAVNLIDPPLSRFLDTIAKRSLRLAPIRCACVPRSLPRRLPPSTNANLILRNLLLNVLRPG